ncbi:muconolactone Delta-isomerase family protein [Nocardioides cheoyonin]|uniref:muconolactone Delta-isomerase family protein n=1 Tax=Nocardioides cheoyonin TaxID=3156615 RepID=UPI0032B570FC
MKFLVLWRLEQGLLSEAMVRSIARMPEYGADLEARGKVLMRYHVVGMHGGAWVYDVDSHEEFERLLAMAPVFNFAHYTVHALADMSQDGLTGRTGSATPGSVSEGGSAHEVVDSMGTEG